jgi:hypothetical protein
MVLLPGWCIECHKVKRVDVRVPRPGDLNMGVCRDCQDRIDQRGRRPHQPRKEH